LPVNNLAVGKQATSNSWYGMPGAGRGVIRRGPSCHCTRSVIPKCSTLQVM
jgi:hypothetical protein